MSETAALSDDELETILGVDHTQTDFVGKTAIKEAMETEAVEILKPAQVKKDVSFSMADLNGAMMEQASLSVHYARIACESKFQMESLKRKIELLEAYLDKNYRQNWPDNEKMTEKAVQSKIILNKNYQDLQEQYLEAKMNASFADSVQESFRQRRDMLIQIGKDAREELKGQVRVYGDEPRSMADAKTLLEEVYTKK